MDLILKKRVSLLKKVYAQRRDFRRGGNEQAEGVYTQYMTDGERVSNNADNSCAKRIDPAFWLSTVVVLLSFFLPISSTGKSIFLGALVALIVGVKDYRERLFVLISTPFCLASLAFFGLALVATLWSPASLAQKGFVIEKYSKLVYLPFLMIAFGVDQKTVGRALHAFLAAMAVTALIACLKYYGVLAWAIDPDRVFRNHIMTGMMIAFAAYLSVLLFSKTTVNKFRYGYLGLLALFLFHICFVNAGRTAYLTLLTLALLWLVQFGKKKFAFPLIFGLIAITVAAYQWSPLMQKTVKDSVAQVVAYTTTEKNSSLGLRFQFHAFAKDLFLTHPVIGNGTASFTYYFDEKKPVPAWGLGHKLLEPHSQYWLTAVEFGLLGLAIFAAIIVSLTRVILNREPFMRAMGLGMLLPFLIGNLHDSLLFYSGSGYFFLVFIAMVACETPSKPA